MTTTKSKYKLIITIPFNEIGSSRNDDEEEDIRREAVDFIEALFGKNCNEEYQYSLIREGDRSGKNLLLPKIEGRVGSHFQTRKATIKDFIAKEEEIKEASKL